MSFIVKTRFLQSANVGDVCLLAQHVITTSEQLQQHLKQAKRRLPTDQNVIKLGFDKDLYDTLNLCFQHATRVLKTMHEIAKNATQVLATSGGKF